MQSIRIFLLSLLVLLLPLTTLYSIEKHSSTKAWLGVVVRDATSQAHGEKGGALIVRVEENSPAESAGLKEGDVILRINKKVIENSRDLVLAVRELQPNEKVEILYRREKSEKRATVTLAEAPRMIKKQIARIHPGIRCNWCEGMKLHTLTEQLAEYFGVPEHEGVLVEAVAKGSSAANAGIKAGDVIVRIGKKRIDEVKDIRRELMKYEEGDTVLVEIVRNRSTQQVPLKLEKLYPTPMFQQFHGFSQMIDGWMFEEPFDFCDYFRKFNMKMRQVMPNQDFDDEL